MFKRFKFFLLLIFVSQGLLFAPSKSSPGGVAQELCVDQLECSICRELYSSSNSYIPCLNCDHGFCIRCTDKMARYRISQCPLCRRSMENVEGVTGEGTSCQQGIAERLIPISAETAAFIARLHDLGARLDESERLRREENERHYKAMSDMVKEDIHFRSELQADASRKQEERFRRSALENEEMYSRNRVESAKEIAWDSLRRLSRKGISAIARKQRDMQCEERRIDFEVREKAFREERDLGRQKDVEERSLRRQKANKEEHLQTEKCRTQVALAIVRDKEEAYRLIEEAERSGCLGAKEVVLRCLKGLEELSRLSELSTAGLGPKALEERLEAQHRFCEQNDADFAAIHKAQYLKEEREREALALREEARQKEQQLRKEARQNEARLHKEALQQDLQLREETQRLWVLQQEEENRLHAEKRRREAVESKERIMAIRQSTAELYRMLDEEENKSREAKKKHSEFGVLRRCRAVFAEVGSFFGTREDQEDVPSLAIVVTNLQEESVRLRTEGLTEEVATGNNQEIPKISKQQLDQMIEEAIEEVGKQVQFEQRQVVKEPLSNHKQSANSNSSLRIEIAYSNKSKLLVGLISMFGLITVICSQAKSLVRNTPVSNQSVSPRLVKSEGSLRE